MPEKKSETAKAVSIYDNTSDGRTKGILRVVTPAPWAPSLEGENTQQSWCKWLAKAILSERLPQPAKISSRRGPAGTPAAET